MLDFLYGKRKTLIALVGLITTFCVSQGYISLEVAGLINSVVVLLAGYSNYEEWKFEKDMNSLPFIECDEEDCAYCQGKEPSTSRKSKGSK